MSCKTQSELQHSTAEQVSLLYATLLYSTLLSSTEHYSTPTSTLLYTALLYSTPTSASTQPLLRCQLDTVIF